MTPHTLPELTPQEASELRDALRTAAAPDATPASFSALLTRWGTLVAEVERGYQLTAYDYTNDLSARDRLAELAAELSPALRAKVMSAVAPLDERFERATEQIPAPLAENPHPWWRRIPRKRDAEFDETM